MLIPDCVLLLKSPLSEDGQDKYETILKTHNFEVRQVKTLVFNFKNIAKLTEKLAQSSQYSGVILSSPRCAQAVQMASADSHCLENWKSKRNFVVGEATYKIALEKLHLECLGKESGNAANLSQIILEDKTHYSHPLLFPHGNLKTDTLNVELGKEGVQIEGIEVYDTIANPNLDSDLAKATDNFKNIPEFVVFFSPSGFSSAFSLIQRVPVDINQIKFIAIGPVTEMAIAEKDLPVFGVAKRPNPDELLNVLLKR